MATKEQKKKAQKKAGDDAGAYPKGTKHFKLGPVATLFVDPATKKKIAGQQVVPFEPKHQKSDKFNVAKRHGHIVEASDEDLEDASDSKSDSNSSQALASFMALDGTDAKKRYLVDTYEMTDEEEVALDGMTDEQLTVKFKEYEGIA
jgi:hypothetical protein